MAHQTNLPRGIDPSMGPIGFPQSGIYVDDRPQRTGLTSRPPGRIGSNLKSRDTGYRQI